MTEPEHQITGHTTGPRAWITLAILISASILSFIDRQVLSFMVAPIKADLGLSDIQISLLQGVAFAAFYAVAAIPIGALMDRTNRVRLLALGITLWSVMTAAGGFAQNFVHLFAARVGVGVGEATLGPAAHSMIADLFPRHRLPFAMSVYALGVAVGVGIGYAAGGVLVAHFVAAGPLNLAVLGLIKPWQVVFLLVGLPGLGVALLIRLVAHDPPRRQTSQAHDTSDVTGFLRAHWRVLVPLVAAICCFTATSFATLSWAPELLRRQWHLPADRAGLLLGGLMVLGPLPGGLACGAIAERLTRRGDPAGGPLVMAIAALVASPFIALACVSHVASTALGAMVVPMLVAQCYVGLAPAAVQGLTPPAMRARIAALYLLITSLFGMSVGPFMVAWITDRVLADESRLGLALGITAAGFNFMGAILMFCARPAYRRAVSRAH